MIKNRLYCSGQITLAIGETHTLKSDEVCINYAIYKKKDLEKTIENIDKQLSVFMSKHNTLSTELNTACKIPTSLTPFLDKDMAECLTLLKQQLEFEIKQYPFNQAIPEDASDAQKKVIADLNTLNKIKYDYAKSDLNMVESLSGTDELEKAPRSTAILQKYVRDNNLFGNDTNIVIDILDTKSAEIAIFRQKIKVLERNSRVLLSKDDFYGGCGTFDEDNSVNMSYKGDICRLARSLNTKLNKKIIFRIKTKLSIKRGIKVNIL